MRARTSIILLLISQSISHSLRIIMHWWIHRVLRTAEDHGSCRYQRASNWLHQLVLPLQHCAKGNTDFHPTKYGSSSSCCCST